VVLLPACCLGEVAKRILEKNPLETLSVSTGCPSLDKLYVFIVFSDQSGWVEKINISRSAWTPPHSLRCPFPERPVIRSSTQSALDNPHLPHRHRPLNRFCSGLGGWLSPDPEVDLSGGHCRIGKYFLHGNAEHDKCLYQHVCRSWNASGLSFRLVDGDFDSDRMAAGTCGLIHSLTVPPRSDEHGLEGFGESASLGVIRGADDADLLPAKRRENLYERVSLAGESCLSVGSL